MRASAKRRAVLAWIGACILATLAHVFGSSAVLLSHTMGLSIFLSGPALVMFEPKARRDEWRRPTFDIALFAVCALLLPFALSLGLLVSDAAEFFKDTSQLEVSFTGGSNAGFMALNAMLALASGALGGLAYWLFAGAPRPPY